MNNDLLEQWRKEAEACGELLRDSSTHNDWSYYDLIGAYIEGCKATHEKMQKEHRRLKELILKAGNHLNIILDNMEGSVGSADNDDYIRDYNNARLFIDSNFK